MMFIEIDRFAASVGLGRVVFEGMILTRGRLVSFYTVYRCWRHGAFSPCMVSSH